MVASEPEDDVPKQPPPMENTEDKMSKRYYRQEVWTAMRSRCPQVPTPNKYINRKIPFFPEAEQAAERLAETPEFKEAKNIKVNIDMAQEAVKLQVLKHNKTLFVAPSQKSDFLYAKIKLPTENLEEVPPVQQRRIVKMLAGEDTYEELGIDQTEPLDMLVVGCVAVSNSGQRIGKGNGYVDLEVAILMSLGVITPKTVIATTVADEQLYEELPQELFKNYDFTVDLIVTPTKVCRVQPRPEPRAIGVEWGLLSSRRLDVVRVLQKMKERLEAQGQQIELKGEDTDVESFRKQRSRGGGGAGAAGADESGQQERRRKQNRRRRSTRNGGGAGAGGAAGGDHEDSNDQNNDPKERRNRKGRGGGGGAASNEEGGADGAAGGQVRPKNRRQPKPRRSSRRDSSEYEGNGGENGANDRRRPQPAQEGGKGYGGGRNRSNKDRERGGEHQQQSRPGWTQKPPLPAGVCIRVSNMFSVRLKDFKNELRKRNCYPAKINKPRFGRCLLIFPDPEDNEEHPGRADELLEKLANLRIDLHQKPGAVPKTVELKCAVLQQKRKGDDEDPEDVVRKLECSFIRAETDASIAAGKVAAAGTIELLACKEATKLAGILGTLDANVTKVLHLMNQVESLLKKKETPEKAATADASGEPSADAAEAADTVGKVDDAPAAEPADDVAELDDKIVFDAITIDGITVQDVSMKKVKQLVAVQSIAVKSQAVEAEAIRQGIMESPPEDLLIWANKGAAVTIAMTAAVHKALNVRKVLLTELQKDSTPPASATSPEKEKEKEDV